MGYQNAYAAYQKTNVNTASQGRLVVLLYEGAVKHLKAALNLFDANGKIKAGDIEQFGIHLQKTQAIITELQVSLDMEKGGDISRNLMSLYVYFNEELMDATISHNKQKIEFVLSKVDELADAWRTIRRWGCHRDLQCHQRNRFSSTYRSGANLLRLLQDSHA